MPLRYQIHIRNNLRQLLNISFLTIGIYSVGFEGDGKCKPGKNLKCMLKMLKKISMIMK